MTFPFQPKISACSNWFGSAINISFITVNVGSFVFAVSYTNIYSFVSRTLRSSSSSPLPQHWQSVHRFHSFILSFSAGLTVCQLWVMQNQRLHIGMAKWVWGEGTAQPFLYLEIGGTGVNDINTIRFVCEADRAFFACHLAYRWWSKQWLEELGDNILL